MLNAPSRKPHPQPAAECARMLGLEGAAQLSAYLRHDPTAPKPLIPRTKYTQAHFCPVEIRRWWKARVERLSEFAAVSELAEELQVSAVRLGQLLADSGLAHLKSEWKFGDSRRRYVRSDVLAWWRMPLKVVDQPGWMRGLVGGDAEIARHFSTAPATGQVHRLETPADDLDDEPEVDESPDPTTQRARFVAARSGLSHLHKEPAAC